MNTPEQDRTPGPLAGIRVIDLSMLLPGPLCSQHLGDMGASVIKIENPRVPDLIRYSGKRIHSALNKESSESSMFLALNRNKESVTLNIKRPEGRQVLRELLADADVLLEGFRPGTMDNLGIGYSDLKADFPRLVYCAISGYGATGPYRDMAGHDGNYIAISGILDQNGKAGQAPVVPAVQFADTIGGSFQALSAILAALYAREKTGYGQFLDVSMMDGAFCAQPLQLAEVLADGQTTERGKGLLSGGLPNYDIYACRDGKYVMLAALEERFLRVFLKQAGRSDLLENFDFKKDDPEILRPALASILKSKNRSDWQELFTHSDTCLSPVNNLAEAINDPQIQARGLVQTVEHPELGAIRLIGSPFQFSQTPCSIRSLPPAHGEHTDQVLKQLGLDQEQIQNLRAKRVI
ncbi:MAG: CoA transferase [Leptospiraceae bacterium]|nr:CoA transferase [Leptospiraceae bacterium]